MLDKCANPACSKTFRTLRDGKVFAIEVQTDYQRKHQRECASTSAFLALQVLLLRHHSDFGQG